MGQTYNTIDQASDTQTQVNTKLADRTDTLRSSFSGTSAPGSPVEGQIHIDTSATPYIVYIYADIGAGAAWVKIGPLARFNGDINLDPSSGDTRASVNQIKGVRLENRGSHVTPAAGNAGFVYYHTGDGYLYYNDGVASARGGMLTILDGTSKDTVEIALDGDNDNGATPPTTWNAGTSPAVRGWLFDATGESRTLTVPVPANWDGASDLTLETYWAIDSAETAGDDIEVDCAWVSITPGADPVNKTSTAAATAATDIGAVTTQYSVFKVTTTIDHDDATNPVAAGDILSMEINRATVGGAGYVAGAALIAARLTYAQKARHARA